MAGPSSVAESLQPSGMPEHDLTKVEGLHSYINACVPGYESCNVQRLDGGTANHVYRMELAFGVGTIFKHATDQLASDPSHTLDASRMDFEAGFLERLLDEERLASPSDDSRPCCAMQGYARVQIKQTHTHPVAFKSYHKHRKLLNLEDGGPINLKDAYSKLSRDDIEEIGTELGTWLANFHENTDKTHVTSAMPGHSNNTTGIAVCRHSYENLPDVVVAQGHDPSVARLINEEVGSLFKSDDECVCHGDFWPGNILLRSAMSDQGPFTLTVIDWEMVRIGSSTTDVGQFAAEAFLLDSFRGEKGLHAAFMNAYAAARTSIQIDHAWLLGVAVHFAVHLAFWPARKVHWTREEDTLKITSIGTSALRMLEDIVYISPNPSSWSVFRFPETWNVKEYVEWLRKSNRRDIRKRIRSKRFGKKRKDSKLFVETEETDGNSSDEAPD
ncbi:hypothetical protein BU25DRAFT_408235 [Macroventuria anomochaeta]|uniref:Uncharacterized protein n=1 Tax=Macroventuria anomochaeta TaxID=301207 RepID=A0ACB6SAY2_9PLEO|nr:uncharacterized protein BU25DRAFT_408235 [Macroventuria anomochaeta]KAF2630262.1 hypothetical protein BU25DRAFT_408235 [Macroventuria anomochaeta]